jgi:hypothetical protein
MRADLGGANLAHARNLVQGQLFGTIGDASTLLPPHLERPATWPGSTRDIEREPPKQQVKSIQPQRSWRLMSWL